MSNKIIDEILLSEKEAEKIVKNAKQIAIKSLTQAEEKAQDIKNNAQQKFKDDLVNLVKEYEEDSKVFYKESLSQYKKTAEELEKKAEENKQSAIDLIVSKIK